MDTESIKKLRTKYVVFARILVCKSNKTYFAQVVENKILLLSYQPSIGSLRNIKQPYIRQTVLHKRILLIYRVKSRKKEIEILLFWNTAQSTSKFKV